MKGGLFQVLFGSCDDRYACTGLCYDILPSNTQNNRVVISDFLWRCMDKYLSCSDGSNSNDETTKAHYECKKKDSKPEDFNSITSGPTNYDDPQFDGETCVLATKAAMLMRTRLVTISVVRAALQVCGRYA